MLRFEGQRKRNKGKKDKGLRPSALGLGERFAEGYIIGGQRKPFAQGMGGNKHIKGANCLSSGFKPCTEFSIGARENKENKGQIPTFNRI